MRAATAADGAPEALLSQLSRAFGSDPCVKRWIHRGPPWAPSKALSRPPRRFQGGAQAPKSQF